MKIPFFDIKRQVHMLENELGGVIRDIHQSGGYILGPVVEDFEKEVASYAQCAHGVGVASGSDALWLSLLAMDIGPGDEVITTPYTFIASASAITKTGATPVFVDIDLESLNISPDKIIKAITPSTKAIMPVHLFGLCAEMDKIGKIARDHDLAIIEDAAQAFGAACQHKRAGNLGLIAALSFYPTKNLGGFGDGGMILTSDTALARRLRMLRVHGSVNQYEHKMWGWNSRLDSLQAAMLHIKLPLVESWIQKRVELSRRYRSAFMSLPLRLPVEGSDQYRHTYNQFVIRTDCRNKLAEYLKEKGIGTAVYYHIPLHLQECFEYLGYHQGDFTNAEKASQECLALPIFPELMSQEQDYIIQSVTDFFH